MKFRKDPVFGFEVPDDLRGRAGARSSTRPTPGAAGRSTSRKYDALAARFIENFKLMMDGCPEHVVEAGPKRLSHIPKS